MTQLDDRPGGWGGEGGGLSYRRKNCIEFACVNGPLHRRIFIAQLNAIFVALKLQRAAISSRFSSLDARLFRKQKLCDCSKVNCCSKSRVSRVASQTATINCTKIALKSQPVYTRDFEVETLAQQKLH